MARPRPALLIALVSAIGVAVAVAIGLSSGIPGGSSSVESVGKRPAATSSASPSTLASASAPVSVSTPQSSPVVPVSFPIPRRVEIPAIDVRTKVVPVGLEGNGAIEIPEDIRLVGWYDLGVPPGADRGSAVLVAHRDGREQGRGVFYDLGLLEVDDRVVVRTDEGSDLAFSVVSRESIRKKRLPYEELFAVDGPPRLTLISCGGPYDPDAGGYQDNVVVTAVPLES